MAHFENHQSHQPNYQPGNQPPVELTIQLNNLNVDGKVRNPLTGIYIYADGRLATRLRKEGILDPSTAPPNEHKIRRTPTGPEIYNFCNTRKLRDPRVTSKTATFVVNKITREDLLDQPHVPEINQRLNQSQHTHYQINFQSKH